VGKGMNIKLSIGAYQPQILLKTIEGLYNEGEFFHPQMWETILSLSVYNKV